MLRFRFLQLSDLHLGASVSSVKLGLSDEKQIQRKQEFDNLVRIIPSIMEDYQLDALMIPGDLWDHETLTGTQLEQFRILYQAICELAPKPVVIAPGNHDFYSQGSMYHPNALRSKGFKPWPEHVCIFTDPSFKTLSLPGWEGKVKVTGRAFQDNILLNPDREDNNLRLLKDLYPQEPAEMINIMLFHGSRDDQLKLDNKMTAPFSKEELVNSGFDYVAVGHYHRYELFKNQNNEIKGAYAGSPFGRGLDETGARNVLIVEISKTDDKQAVVSVEPVTSDKRSVICREIQLYGVNSLEDAENQIAADLSFYAKTDDMIFCELKGQVAPDLPRQWTKMLETKLMNNHGFFHVNLNMEKVTPAYDILRLREDPYSLEGRYIKAIENKIENAKTEEEKTVLNKALYLGLDALTGCEAGSP